MDLINKLKNVDKVGLLIVVIILFLLIVAVDVVFDRDTGVPAVVNNEIVVEENEAVKNTNNTPSSKTGTSPSSGGSTKRTTPSQINFAAIFPSAQLIADGRVQDSAIGAYCWIPLGLCADVIITDLPDVDPLIAVRNSSLKLKLDTNVTPLSVKVTVRKPIDSIEEYIKKMSKLVIENIQLSPNKDTSFLLNIDPGVYILTVNTVWQEGGVEFNFKIEVR